MNKIFANALAAVILGGVTACGDSFLDTEMSNTVDNDVALNSASNIDKALNGTYYRLFDYRFAGNYATMVGDLSSDISYWNTKNSHQNELYEFTYTDTSITLRYIWQYGYMVADHAARIITAANELLPGASEDEQADLILYRSEAQCLRAYAHFVMVNIFGHQIKVNGQDFSDQPGIVIINKHKEYDEKVGRATVGESYASVVTDLKDAIAGFDAIGGDRDDMYYFGKAAACGLLARVSLYMENYADAKSYAAVALSTAGITELAYTESDYKSLFNYGQSNKESLFALAINTSQNWSANSCGTLWTTYAYSPAPKLVAMYGEQDVRKAIMGFDKENSTETEPYYAGGKFACYSYGNPAYATNYLINAPEMFLIQAEADIKSATGTAADAAAELLVVAKRNKAITSVADLPADKDGLFAFLKDERARELFQEGHRCYDLRRWDVKTDLYATGYPEQKYLIKDFQISNVVFPISQTELNTGMGVTQTPGWAEARPQ